MDVDLLLRIDGELDSEEVEELKFLCRDHVPQKQLETVEAAQDLFLRLQDQGLLGEDCLFLAELLLTIRRLDLLRLLGTSPKEVEESVNRQAGSHSRVSPYRKMLYELSEDITKETLKSFKLLLQLPRNRVESCPSFLDVLVEMEKLDMLREDSVDELQRVFHKCNRQLATKVQEYAAQQAAGGSTAQSGTGQEYLILNGTLLGNSGPKVPQQLPIPSVPEFSPTGNSIGACLGENQSLCLDVGSRHSPDEDPEDYYKTSSRPLGYCLIINNYSFEVARQRGLGLGDRRGTDMDEKLLQEVFSRLHFRVEVYRDLMGEKLREVVCEFGRRDHSKLDVFACCVLSHGEKGSVHATDGTSVPIRRLTLPFTSTHCPSLALKPKLFFIQACQGEEMQRGAVIQADGLGDEKGEEEAYRADASRFMQETVPDDSDFLLGMATVEDYRSFRNVMLGSIFIQQLCCQLVKGCEQKEDILTIMTRVNREVSSGVYLKSKQMPEPRYTLRKKLVLPID